VAVTIGDKTMEISNFKLVDVIGHDALNLKYKAVVDVTTKKGFFRKPVTEQKEVFKTYAGRWYFIENGEYTPYIQVENLARKLEAEKGKDLEKCLDS
jgi:hypothetical protein